MLKKKKSQGVLVSFASQVNMPLWIFVLENKTQVLSFLKLFLQFLTQSCPLIHTFLSDNKQTVICVKVMGATRVRHTDHHWIHLLMSVLHKCPQSRSPYTCLAFCDAESALKPSLKTLKEL